jgi:hypothetical protein
MKKSAKKGGSVIDLMTLLQEGDGNEFTPLIIEGCGSQAFIEEVRRTFSKKK